jgi:hypothetical protein
VPASYKDIEIRIRGAKAGSNGQTSNHDVEVRVENSGLWTGSSKLDLYSLDLSNPEAYGEALGAQLANPSLLRALDQAGLTRGERLRIRLLLDDDVQAPHWIRWERIRLPIDGVQWPLASHPKFAFSRYIPMELPDEDPPDHPTFRLLYAVSNPEGLEGNSIIKVEEEISNFLEAFEQGPAERRLEVTVLPGHTLISDLLRDRIVKQGWKVLTRRTTLQNISDQLHDGFHGLHLLAHGDFNPQTGIGSLLLENDAGGKAMVEDGQLQSWVTLDLKIVLLQACYGGAPPAENMRPFTGVAPHLIRLGIPAAVAMQDEVKMDDARLFFSEFYRVLLNEGRVDAAVNQGRQVLQKPGEDNWSIPALFSRLRGGQLWHADPLRECLLRALADVPNDADQKPLPLQAIEHTRGLTNYDPIAGASGPRFDLASHVRELACAAGSITVLTGGRGFAKVAQIYSLFHESADRFLRGDAAVPLPVFLTLSNLAERTSDSWPALSQIWAGETRVEEEPLIAGRQFLFLIDGEAELAGNVREVALEALGRLRSLAGSSTLIVADEALLPSLASHCEEATLLVVQPLEWPRVSAYLETLQTDSARSLQKQIRERGFIDLVSQPRFLQHLLELSRRGVPLTSRRQILSRICGTYLAKVNTQIVPQWCVEEAARRIAWHIQDSGDAQVSGSDLYLILSGARADRDFALSALLHELVDNSRLLVPSGDEGVRFVYPPLQHYFAAQYLAAAPERTRRLHDITASFGRMARIRRWEKVLVLLTNLIPCPNDLLRTIVAGSPFLEGEQLFVAVHCYQEAVAERKDCSDMNDVVDQMIDALIWRSGWDERRTFEDREKALQGLVELASLYAPRQAQVVPHLVALACDPIPGSAARASKERFDWSGIRQIAATGAVRLLDETTKYLNDQRPELVETVLAWQKFTTNPEAISCLLVRDDPRISPIAAFALAQSDREEDRRTLISAYDRLQDLDVKWGVVEALSGLESGWVHDNVVKPWIQQAASVSDGSDEIRRAHICYLIQTSSLADAEALDFIAACLRDGSPWLQGRALRGLAKLQDEKVEAWLRPLAEQILAGDRTRIDSQRMKVNAKQLAEATLRRSALVALSDIGDVHSLDVIRSSRTSANDDYELRQVSFHVAEEIYWRLTGGLENESYTGAAFQT